MKDSLVFLLFSLIFINFWCLSHDNDEKYEILTHTLDSIQEQCDSIYNKIKFNE